MLFSVKMRASQRCGDEYPRHISGAERIVPGERVGETLDDLHYRAFHHDKGTPDDVTMSVHAIPEDEIVHLEAMERVVPSSENLRSAEQIIIDELGGLGIDAPTSAELISALREIREMRGAAVIDIRTLQRRDHYGQRGVRVTALDNDLPPECMRLRGALTKPYYYEALTLATKVASAPGIVAELCISDDPLYTTGYIAHGTRFVRVEHIKESGSPQGGRIFLFDGDDDTLAQMIDYLENTPVIVHNIPRIETLDRSDLTELTRQQLEAAEKLERERQAELSGPSASCCCGIPSLADRAAEALAEWEARGLRRFPLTFDSPQLPVSTISGKATLLFSSSNYLGFGEHPALISAATEAVAQWGTGSGGSRLTTGTLQEHLRCEATVAEFMGYEAAVLFGTGFQANGAVLATLGALFGTPEQPLAIFADSLNHASLIDGIRMATRRSSAGASATLTIYPHGDTTALRQELAASEAKYKLIVSDGVFSMDGDVADLPGMMQAATEFGAWVYIDDAHGVGTVGETGRGLLEWYGDSLDHRPELLLVTASKALGVEGAAVCCSTPVAELLRNRARGYVFSTAAPAGSVAAIRAAIEELEAHPEHTQRLQDNATYLRTKLREAGIPLVQDRHTTPGVIAGEGLAESRDVCPSQGEGESRVGDTAQGEPLIQRECPTPIIPVMVGDEGKAVEIATALSEQGIHAPAIRYPTVKRGEAIIRLTVMATHTYEQIDRLVEALAPHYT